MRRPQGGGYSRRAQTQSHSIEMLLTFSEESLKSESDGSGFSNRLFRVGDSYD